MYSSPSKKPKLEDVEINKEIDQQKEANQNPPEDDIEWENEECFRGMTREDIKECCKGMTTEDIKEYSRYSLQVEESDGFDVEFVPKVFPNFLYSFILPCDKKDPKEWEMVKDCVDYVIEQYNVLMKGKSRLQLKSIEKANRTQSHYSCLFITFDAEDKTSLDVHTYQAEVSRNCEIGGSPSLSYPPFLLSIRKKGSKEGFCVPIDLNDQEESVRLEKFARHAISRYNEDQEGKSVLEYVRVVKALRDMNMFVNSYWITFEAKDTISNQVNSYFAQVVYNVDARKIGMQGDVKLETES